MCKRPEINMSSFCPHIPLPSHLTLHVASWEGELKHGKHSCDRLLFLCFPDNQDFKPHPLFNELVFRLSFLVQGLIWGRTMFSRCQVMVLEVHWLKLSFEWNRIQMTRFCFLYVYALHNKWNGNTYGNKGMPISQTLILNFTCSILL